MHRRTALWIAGLVVALVAPLRSQTTGMPSFNAPYRVFQRSEIGVVVSFPDGAGFGLEGVYRYASGKFDIGFRAGMQDPGEGDNTLLLLGAEGRSRIITHNADFPLDGALVAGVGTALRSGSTTLYIPFGLSLGRRVDIKNSKMSIVPYVQPTAFFAADGESDLFFTLGFGADARLSQKIDARFSAGIGDLDGVSFAVVWVH
jgi:hypothetical protein